MYISQKTLCFLRLTWRCDTLVFSLCVIPCDGAVVYTCDVLADRDDHAHAFQASRQRTDKTPVLVELNHNPRVKFR